MKLIQYAVLSVVLAVSLTGCTDSSPMRGPEQGSPTAETAPGVTPLRGL
ncbi:hypothetical protein NMQ03_10865 [Arthrobacter sp. DNA4]|nr:hypothetical protein [Arthrobacter sp. DNA4]UTT67821.1 hypothetical protein NMQ03_10865 [Arthrobacter sp. DNA4]